MSDLRAVSLERNSHYSLLIIHHDALTIHYSLSFTTHHIHV
jgi:hypothetical protein